MTGVETTLSDLIDRIEKVGEELTIYAKRPWTPSSAAVLTTEDDEGEPLDAAAEFEYFLEVDLVREVIQAWSGQRDGAKPTSEQKYAAVIHYAEEDAYLPPEDE